MAKAKAVTNCDSQIHDAFEWTLTDIDGRAKAFQEWHGEDSVRHWVSLYRPHHFVWKRPSDELLTRFEDQVTTLGRQTWKGIFRRYWFHQLKKHDIYSLPDVYYCCQALGEIPSVTIDVGGGWGRLGMAWMAVGCKSAAVVDSIEQPYILQNVYLRSVPGVAFQELLENDDADIDLSSFQGISHFPLWKLTLVKERTVDVVSAIQVLREVNRSMLFFLFSSLKRLLRPGGIFYVRDNDHTYSEACAHDVNVTEYLLSEGFELAFRSSLAQGREIHGVPRIFRWKG